MAYEISYAYATSPQANEFKKPDGCYVLDDGVTKQPFDFYPDARLAARGEPGRWSIDHPLNTKYLPTSGAAK